MLPIDLERLSSHAGSRHPLEILCLLENKQTPCRFEPAVVRCRHITATRAHPRPLLDMLSEQGCGHSRKPHHYRRPQRQRARESRLKCNNQISCSSDRPALSICVFTRTSSVEVRAAQVEAAARAFELAARLFHFRGAVRAHLHGGERLGRRSRGLRSARFVHVRNTDAAAWPRLTAVPLRRGPGQRNGKNLRRRAPVLL